MPRQRQRNGKALVRKAAEIGIAAPQVIAHRTMRMATAGPVWSDRDRREFQRMGLEKIVAFGAAWQGMVLQALQANQSMFATFARSFWFPWWWAPPSRHAVARRLRFDALGIAAKGVAPIHRTAVANAKRLAATGAGPRRPARKKS